MNIKSACLRRLLVIALFFAFTSDFKGYGQSLDSLSKGTEEYFTDLTDHLAIRLFTLTKFNSLNINDENRNYILRPNGKTNLGIGFNFKFIGIGLSFGLPQSQNRIYKYGKTSAFDLQVSVFGTWFGFDGYIQSYKGYFLSNPKDFMNWDKDYQPQIPDMSISSIGLMGFYIFNNKKYSYKAAYNKTQIQNRSAGSFILGIFAHTDAGRTDNGFIPREVRDSIQTDFDLSEFDLLSVGVSVGYMYTFVIKKNFSINLSLIPGFGVQKVSLKAIDGTGGIETQPAAQLLARASLSYEFKWFYAGFVASNIFRNFSYNNYNIDLGTQKIRFYIGKRFDVSKKKKP